MSLGEGGRSGEGRGGKEAGYDEGGFDEGVRLEGGRVKWGEDWTTGGQTCPAGEERTVMQRVT